MRSCRHIPWHLISALISGISLTLTVLCGVIIMRMISSNYPSFFPAMADRAPSITRWFDTLPRSGGPSLIALGLLLTGFTWLAAQTQESALAVLQRVSIAFVTTGICAFSLPFIRVCQLLAIDEPPVPWTVYRNELLWLIPSAVPLAIALIKHRRSARMSMPAP